MKVAMIFRSLPITNLTASCQTVGLLLFALLIGGCDLTVPSAPPKPTGPPVARKDRSTPQVAQMGVGKKSSTITMEGVVATPVRALFVVEEKTVFEIQIPHTMNTFKALHGRAPNSHEEFMEKIIGNQIRLPELPDGNRYQYDPQTEQLMVYPIDR